MKTNKKMLRNAFIFSFGVLCFFTALYYLFKINNIVFNHTTSYPIGLYSKIEIKSNINKGDLVMFCIPITNTALAVIKDREYLSRGDCESGLMPLIKKVFGVAGDYVSMNNFGVNVNNDFRVINSKPILVDVEGRNLPLIKNGFIKKGYYLLLSDYNERSFDSRYFGTIERSNILYNVKPLMVIGDSR